MDLRYMGDLHWIWKVEKRRSRADEGSHGIMILMESNQIPKNVREL